MNSFIFIFQYCKKYFVILILILSYKKESKCTNLLAAINTFYNQNLLLHENVN